MLVISHFHRSLNKRKIQYVGPLPDTTNVIENKLTLFQPFTFIMLKAKSNPF